MKPSNIQDLLKKINYIEADLEIHKQILFATPSDQKGEMEKIVAVIAQKTKEVQLLREQIKELDPEEFQRIMVFEEAINSFKKLASEKQFSSVVSRSVGEDCTLALEDGSNEDCLIKACDQDGHWTIISLDGEIKQFHKSEVREIAPSQSSL